MAGICPSCKGLVTQARCEGLDVNVPGGVSWKGISLQCPHCNTVLSVSIDPIAIKADIVADLLKSLQKNRLGL